ncbi:MAG TPA: hypothetical protein VNR88_02310 [Hyphomicrobium sp.]|nr:hypothetical protein [Hyphomicrobium sp.]
MDAEKIYNEVVIDFEQRKFAAGLAVTFIDFLDRLGVPEDQSIDGLEALLRKFPKQELKNGKRVATLAVGLPDGSTTGLRPHYNRVEAFFRAQSKRFDYPSCPGHATKAWADYQHWLNALCGLSKIELHALRKRICTFVLDKLPSQAFDPATLISEPALFSLLLDQFPLEKHKDELTGASYQGVVFGFLRADNPHLQVEISKVRTGSKRLGRVGDIDAWEGARLAITAEVKQYAVAEKHVEDLQAFANEVNLRGAIGIVCGLSFDAGVRDSLEELGVRTLDLQQMLEIVSLWDPMKQRIAVASMTYYVKHVEKSSALLARLDAFLLETIKAFDAARGSPQG